MALSELVGGLGLATKVVLATGAVAVGIAGAGAAGALPGPVQGGVATAVESVTPFDLPARGNIPSTPAGDGQGVGTAEVDVADDPPAADEAAFGMMVRDEARQGGVDGAWVRDAAHAMAAERAAAGLANASGTPASDRVPDEVTAGGGIGGPPEGVPPTNVPPTGAPPAGVAPAGEPPEDVPPVDAPPVDVPPVDVPPATPGAGGGS